MTWREAAAPLRNRTFAWYVASRTTDTLGSMMAGVALAFAVLGVTDSATALGQVLAAHYIPLVVFMLYGGVLADRYPRTLVIQASNLVAAASQGTLAFLVITGQAELWTFAVLAAVNGMADAANFPAMAGMVPQLVPRDQLQPANALLSLTGRADDRRRTTCCPGPTPTTRSGRSSRSRSASWPSGRWARPSGSPPCSWRAVRPRSRSPR